MTNEKFSWEKLFAEFQSREIDTEELEDFIKEIILQEHPGDTIEDLKYTDDGVEVTMDSGEEVEIEIDWNEIILA